MEELLEDAPGEAMITTCNLAVWHRLQRGVKEMIEEDCLLRDRGLSGWIGKEPGAALCTIRIKVAISGCYLLRDVLCSQF
ncbi:hypothetical protein NQZ68_036161 [Dissostichus eleginoides]|nr:hypothetical protein NQZ68_036161 [Dissostichus eleginoides]